MQETVGSKREKGQKERLKGKERLLRNRWRVIVRRDIQNALSNKRGGGGKFGD